jgi:hypothetical protein
MWSRVKGAIFRREVTLELGQGTEIDLKTAAEFAAHGGNNSQYIIRSVQISLALTVQTIMECVLNEDFGSGFPYGQD